MGEMWKCSKKLSPDVSVSDASISSVCSSCRSLSSSRDWNTHTSVIIYYIILYILYINPLCAVHVSELNHRPAAWLYLLSVGLGVSSWGEQSQHGAQETLIDLHRHLLNQSHEVPEVHTHSDSTSSLTVTGYKIFILLYIQYIHIHVQLVTHLNCMTLLCWLNLVMTDTSMNGFGSVEEELKS